MRFFFFFSEITNHRPGDFLEYFGIRDEKRTSEINTETQRHWNLTKGIKHDRLM